MLIGPRALGDKLQLHYEPFLRPVSFPRKSHTKNPNKNVEKARTLRAASCGLRTADFKAMLITAVCGRTRTRTRTFCRKKDTRTA